MLTWQIFDVYAHFFLFTYVRVLITATDDSSFFYVIITEIYCKFSGYEEFVKCLRKLSGNFLEFFALQPHYFILGDALFIIAEFIL